MAKLTWLSTFRDPYTRPLIRALVTQIVLLLFYSLFLDFGYHRQACCKVSAGFWAGTMLILIRRPRNPTPGDLAYIRWAVMPIALIGVEVFMVVWKMKGVI